MKRENYEGNHGSERAGSHVPHREGRIGIEVVGGEIAPDDSGVYTAEKGVFKFYGDELVGSAFDAETREAIREFFDTAYWC